MSDGTTTLFGANYDWDTGVGMVMINKRNMAKTALTSSPASWVSRFASVTLNQYGRDFPTGGMNEAGLVVALMALPDTQYSVDDGRRSVGILEWIQYQLDNAADIADVVRLSQQTRIAGRMGLHYLVADASGRAATIEILSGALEVHTGSDLPVAVLANDSYDRSLAFLRTIKGFGGTKPVPTDIGSLDRFARAASMVSKFSPSIADPIAYAFSILESVHQPDYTKWSVVYDPMTLTMYFKTDVNPRRRSVSLRSFDAACSSPVRVTDINVDEPFSDYSLERNRQLVNAAYDATPFLAGASAEDREDTAVHPETSSCLAARRRSVRH